MSKMHSVSIVGTSARSSARSSALTIATLWDLSSVFYIHCGDILTLWEYPHSVKPRISSGGHCGAPCKVLEITPQCYGKIIFKIILSKFMDILNVWTIGIAWCCHLWGEVSKHCNEKKNQHNDQFIHTLCWNYVFKHCHKRCPNIVTYTNTMTSYKTCLEIYNIYEAHHQKRPLSHKIRNWENGLNIFSCKFHRVFFFLSFEAYFKR